MRPAVRGTPERFRVLIDREPLGAALGIDVDERGNGTVTEPRLYQLIQQPEPIFGRQVNIDILDAGDRRWCAGG